MYIILVSIIYRMRYHSLSLKEIIAFLCNCPTRHCKMTKRQIKRTIHFSKRTQTEIAILSAEIIAKIFFFFYYYIAKYIIYPYFLFRDFRFLSLFFFFFFSLQRVKLNFCIFHRFIINFREIHTQTLPSSINWTR